MKQQFPVSNAVKKTIANLERADETYISSQSVMMQTCIISSLKDVAQTLSTGDHYFHGHHLAVLGDLKASPDRRNFDSDLYFVGFDSDELYGIYFLNTITMKCADSWCWYDGR